MPTNILTFDGEARSGKGTSVAEVNTAASNIGEVLVIDQGRKFRVLAELARGKRQSLDDPAELGSFLRDEQTQQDMLSLLKEIDAMPEADVQSMLYNPFISSSSGQVGRHKDSHVIVTELLGKQVKQASGDGYDTILIDGRATEKHGRAFHEQGLGTFVLGWYFRCDSAIAARRSSGMFIDHDNMSEDQRLHLLAETIKISERNRSDALRAVNPMREPESAFQLDLATYGQADQEKRQAMAAAAVAQQMVAVTTSYTRGVAEMTVPVVGISMSALEQNV